MSLQISPYARVVSPGSQMSGYCEMLGSRVHVIFAIFLAVLAGIAGYLQYFGEPAKCWCPPEFTGSMTEYTNSVCYFSQLYYERRDELPRPDPLPSTVYTNYYKWTPFALLFLAILYTIPELVKNIGSTLFVVKLDNILELSRQCGTGTSETRVAAIGQLTADLQYRFHENERRSRQKNCQWWKLLPSLPVYFWLRQVVSKFVFLFGSVVPVVFIYMIVGLNLKFYGHIVAKNVTGNHSYFPSTILCDMEIMRLGLVNRYTLQCHLPGNDMFERITVLVGFLALVVSSIKSSDFICCLLAPVLEPRNSTYIKRHLEMFTDLATNYDKELCREFTDRYLREDGMYLLRLIGQNSSEAVVCQILSKLWEGYNTKLFEEKPILSPPHYTDEKPLLGKMKISCND